MVLSFSKLAIVKGIVQFGMNEGKETMKQIKNFYSMRDIMDKVKGQLKKNCGMHIYNV